VNPHAAAETKESHMRKIILYSPTIDRHGAYRDAGEELTVGAEDNDDTDLTTKVADELLGQNRAVTPTEAHAIEAAAPDPLDHDGNGEKGGSLPGEQSTRARGRTRAAQADTES
jgi:hypothetical protein